MSSLPLSEDALQRIAGRGLGVKCPACGSNAARERRPGVLGGDRWAVVCVGLDCDWSSLVDVDDAGHAREVELDRPEGPSAAKPKKTTHEQAIKGGRTLVICWYPGCRRRDEIEGKLCPGHRVRWRREGSGQSVEDWLEQERRAIAAERRAATPKLPAAETTAPRRGASDSKPAAAETTPPEPEKEPPEMSDTSRRCRVDGCDRNRQSRGLCPAHWQRWSKCGKPDIEAYVAAGAPVKRYWKKLRRGLDDGPPRPSRPAYADPESNSDSIDQLDRDLGADGGADGGSEPAADAEELAKPAQIIPENIPGPPQAGNGKTVAVDLQTVDVAAVDRVGVTRLGRYLTLVTDDGQVLAQFPDL